MLAGEPREEGICTAAGKLAVLIAGLAEAEGGLDSGLAAFEAMLALDGVLLTDEAGDVVGFETSETVADSTLDDRLWFALAAAIVDLGCRIALAALEALLCLPGLLDELI